MKPSFVLVGAFLFLSACSPESEAQWTAIVPPDTYLARTRHSVFLGEWGFVRTVRHRIVPIDRQREYLEEVPLVDAMARTRHIYLRLEDDRIRFNALCYPGKVQLVTASSSVHSLSSLD